MLEGDSQQGIQELGQKKLPTHWLSDLPVLIKSCWDPRTLSLIARRSSVALSPIVTHRQEVSDEVVLDCWCKARLAAWGPEN